MFSNLSTVCLWARFEVSRGIFQLLVKCEAAVWSLQFPREKQPFSGLDFGDTPASSQQLVYHSNMFVCMWMEKNGVWSLLYPRLKSAKLIDSIISSTWWNMVSKECLKAMYLDRWHFWQYCLCVSVAMFFACVKCHWDNSATLTRRIWHNYDMQNNARYIWKWVIKLL